MQGIPVAQLLATKKSARGNEARTSRFLAFV
jgi:hypothetical protein